MNRNRMMGCLLVIGLAVGAPSGLWAGEWMPASVESFEKFQKAFKAGDADGMWEYLDAESRTAADKMAHQIAESCQKASASDKEKLEAALGKKSADLAKWSGKDVLQSKLFHDKYAWIEAAAKGHPAMAEGKAKVELTCKSNGQDCKVFLRRLKGDEHYNMVLPMPTLP